MPGRSDDDQDDDRDAAIDLVGELPDIVQSLPQGLGALGVAAKYLLRHTSAARMDRAVARCHQEWIEETLRAHADHIADLKTRLADAPPSSRPNAADGAATAERLAEVLRTCTDQEKRRLLGNALINGFEPDVYKAGVVADLLDALRDLTVPDIQFLSSIPADGVKCGPDTFTRELSWPSAKKLLRVSLVKERHDNIEIGPSAVLLRTALGDRMLRYLADPPSSQPQS